MALHTTPALVRFTELELNQPFPADLYVQSSPPTGREPPVESVVRSHSLTPHELNDSVFTSDSEDPGLGMDKPTSQVPRIGVTPPTVTSSKCACAPNCQKPCCVSSPERSQMLITAGDDGLCRTSVSSYGSTDSTDILGEQDGEMSLVGRTQSPPMDESIRCGCHVKVEDKTSIKARNKLIIASLVALVFMIGEVIGGYMANSLAILTDAAHMLSDFASFLISLFAIWVATRPPSRRFSFGWHRAEVVGAVVSVLIIWVLTGVLVYEAIQRCIHQDYDIDPDIMLITACAGVFVNVFMCMVLHQHAHGHGHGHGHGAKERSHGEDSMDELQERHSMNDSRDDMEDGGAMLARRHRRSRRRKQAEDRNINVRAAFIHVIGDLIQSIGVVIAGYVIWFTGWKLADPICTFVFSILVLFSTLNVLKDALRVLMEGTPKHIDYEAVREALQELQGVKHAHSLHIWSLTLNKTALSAHLALEAGANNQVVLDRASRILRQRFSIHQITIQVEQWKEEMGDCGTCQNNLPNKRLSLCWP